MTSSTGTTPVEIGVHHFKALKVLGKGSFGDVYLVDRIVGPGETPETCKFLGKLFAMKILPKEKILKHNLI
jgi:serine/threonine protein kinase